MSSPWPQADDSSAALASDRTRRRLRLTVVVGSALTVAVWISATLFFGQRVSMAQSASSAAGARYIQSQQLIAEARTHVLLSSIYLRDSLLESDTPTAAQRRLDVSAALEKADALLAGYVPILASSDELQRIGQLRLDLALLTAEMAKVDPRSRPFRMAEFLRTELGPRRESVVRLAEEIGRLNRSAYVAYQVEAVGSSRLIQRQLVLTLGIAFLATLGIVGFAFGRVVGLERQVRRQIDDDRQLRSELRRLSSSLIQVREDERRGIARELHDHIGQALLAAKVSLAGAEHAPGQRLSQQLDDARRIVDDALASTRDLSQLLHPSILDDLGLVDAIAEQARVMRERHGIDVTFSHEGVSRRLAREVETATYRIVQEALTNVARHAMTSECAVRVSANAEALGVEVADKGRGLSDTPGRRGLGLVGMRERAILLGGTFEIESGPGAGTTIRASLPIPLGSA